MKEIHINLRPNQSIVEELSKTINSAVTSTHLEDQLIFNNNIGNGTIKQIRFNWGISLLNYNLILNEDIKIVLTYIEENPLEFIVLSKGNVSYTTEASIYEKDFVQLQRFQNIILSNASKSQNIYVFRKGESISLNIIQLFGSEFVKKPNNNIETLQKSLQNIITGQTGDLPYRHFGNFNLQLVENVESLNSIDSEGLVRYMGIEGQMYRILALQILEHDGFENKLALPNSINRSDLIKTNIVSEFIKNNIHEVYTISELARMHGFNPKKMQAGFKLLHDKSVNTYIREKKLELASDLIKNTDLSISEIVYQIGYKSRSYFSKIFFNYYNILPISYRDLVNSKSTISE